MKKNFTTAQSTPQIFEQLGKTGASKNDAEIKVEKALIELNEVRNDLIIAKKEKAASETEAAPYDDASSALLTSSKPSTGPGAMMAGAAATASSFKSA